VEVLYDSPRITISHRPGNTGRAFFCFAGVGLKLGKVPDAEFVKTLDGHQHDQFFVIDKTRSWYNSTAIEITDCLATTASRYASVYTLGNSMGGFGAIYFASRLPGCKAAIAFSAQYSVKSEIVPWEPRWNEWRSQISEWTIPHALVDRDRAVRSFLFFGDVGRDRRHAQAFARHSLQEITIYRLGGLAHNTAGVLRDHGCLNRILDAICLRDEGADSVLRILRDHHIDAISV
jgi:pimeloyl-ACP methyl ester carboxylesterase